MKYRGKADLVIDEEEYFDVQLDLDLEKGGFLIKYVDQNTFNIIHIEEVILNNVEINLPVGLLKKNRIENLFVSKSYGKTHGNYLNGKILNAFNITNKTHLRRIFIKPRSSIISFKYELPKDLQSGYDNSSEIIYCNNHLDNLSLKIQKYDIEIKTSNEYLQYKKNSIFKKEEEISLKLTHEIIQSSIPILFAKLEESNMDINLEGIKKLSNNLPFCKNKNDIPFIFEKIFNYLVKITDEERFRWLKAISFLTESKKKNLNLTIKTIHLYNYLELMCESRGLNKNSLSDLLEVDLSSGNLLKKVRNEIIHNESNLREAIKKSKKVVENCNKNAKFNVIDFNGTITLEPSYFYFKLTSLIHKQIKKTTGIKDEIEINELSYLLNNSVEIRKNN